jgi:hypothetical protein
MQTSDSQSLQAKIDAYRSAQAAFLTLCDELAEAQAVIDDYAARATAAEADAARLHEELRAVLRTAHPDQAALAEIRDKRSAAQEFAEEYRLLAGERSAEKQALELRTSNAARAYQSAWRAAFSEVAEEKAAALLAEIEGPLLQLIKLKVAAIEPRFAAPRGYGFVANPQYGEAWRKVFTELKKFLEDRSPGLEIEAGEDAVLAELALPPELGPIRPADAVTRRGAA